MPLTEAERALVRRCFDVTHEMVEEIAATLEEPVDVWYAKMVRASEREVVRRCFNMTHDDIEEQARSFGQTVDEWYEDRLQYAMHDPEYWLDSDNDAAYQ